MQGGGYRERGCVERRERMKERRRNGRRRRGGGGCWIVGWDEVDKGEAVDAVRRECAERERTGDNCQLVAAAAVADPSVIPSLVLSSVLAVVVDSLSSLDLSSGPPPSSPSTFRWNREEVEQSRLQRRKERNLREKKEDRHDRLSSLE